MILTCYNFEYSNPEDLYYVAAEIEFRAFCTKDLTSCKKGKGKAWILDIALLTGG